MIENYPWIIISLYVLATVLGLIQLWKYPANKRDVSGSRRLDNTSYSVGNLPYGSI